MINQEKWQEVDNLVIRRAFIKQQEKVRDLRTKMNKAHEQINH